MTPEDRKLLEEIRDDANWAAEWAKGQAIESCIYIVAIVVFLIVCGVRSCHGGVVTEQFLDSIAQRESGNNPAAVGKKGERGAWQLRPIAIAEVNRVYLWRFSGNAAAVSFGRAYARANLLIIERGLFRTLGRQPTTNEIYCAWRYGIRGALRSGKFLSTPSYVDSRQNFGSNYFVGNFTRLDAGADTKQRAGTATAGMPNTNSGERATGTVYPVRGAKGPGNLIGTTGNGAAQGVRLSRPGPSKP